MIFLGTPNMLVVDTKARPKKQYRFDAKGELEIEDERIAARFARKFKVKGSKKNAAGRIQKKRVFEN